MTKRLHKALLMLAALFSLGTGAQAQDLSINVASYFPRSQASTSQPVKFTVHNYGNEVTKFKAGVMQNGVTLCEKEFNETIKKYGNYEIQLPIRVKTEYGKDYSYTLYVNTEGDTNSANDTLVSSFTMPTPLDFPYTWNSKSGTEDFKGNLNYNYDSTTDMFAIGGKKTNWRGSVSSKPIKFTPGTKATCTFTAQHSPALTFRIVLDYGERLDTIYNEQIEESATAQEHQISFTADSTAQVIFYTTLNGGFSTYGSLLLGKISFDTATPDLTAAAVQAPCVTRLGQSTEGYEVKIKYDNKSAFDITNPTLGYSYGSQKVSEKYSGTIKAGESLSYTFGTKLDASALGTDTLRAWCSSEQDKKTDNDTVKTEMKVYAVQPFPYTTGFDEGNDLWSQYDGNSDGFAWGLTSAEGWGNIAYFPSASGSDDYLFAPAVAMPEGKSRFSFYYTGGNYKSQHLRVLMGTEPSPEKMTEVLFDSDITNNGWLNGYALIDMPKAATRYFAFQATGKLDQLVIDNVKIDRAEDLCINDVAFDTTTGFERTTSKVTISYINHGLTAQKDITVKYFLNDTKDNPYTSGEEAYATETVKETVQPGDTLYYTFQKAADISTVNRTYTLVGAIATKVGTDYQNDSIVGTSVENWPAKTVPYLQTFDNNEASKQWTFVTTEGGTANHKWLVGISSAAAYSGTKLLAHQNAVAAGSTDWAFSEPIRLKKGTYELSFFYRTTRNLATTAYQQSFRAAMGTAADSLSMTIPVFELSDFTIKGNRAKKVNKQIEITEDGLYYIGFGNMLSGKSGTTYIDNISLEEVSEGQALPFASNFNESDSVFYKYYPMTILSQWKLTKESDGNTVEKVNRTSDDNLYGRGSEGQLVTPKLQLEAGKTVKVTVDYALSCDENADFKLCVYGSKIDNPDSLAVLDSLPVVADSAYAQKTIKFKTGSEATPYFIGLRTSAYEEYTDINRNGPKLYTARVRSIKVEYDTTDGIQEANATPAAAITVSGGRVQVAAPAGSQMTVYDLSGRQVASAGSADGSISLNAAQLKGVYIIKVETPEGITSRKLTF